MLVNVLLFVLGLVLLIFGGDKFVDGAVGIAKKFHLPELLIGATVVSIGTTLPEVMVSSQAALQGSGDTAYGNAIGSVICNTALISAITITFAPSIVNKKALRTPVIFFFGAALLYTGVAYITGEFTRLIGIILLLIFAVYMFITVRQTLNSRKDDIEVGGELPVENNEPATENTEADKSGKTWLMVLYLVLGSAAIAIGARLLVDNGTAIAAALGVPQTVIALTFVALGTSLPELVTAITSLVKGHGSLSLGNIIGANLFNLVLVSGLSITLCPFPIPQSSLFGMNSSYILDIPVMFIVMGILTVPALIKGKLKRWQGITMLVIYALFCAMQFFIK